LRDKVKNTKVKSSRFQTLTARHKKPDRQEKYNYNLLNYESK